jgi:hypothetical protein
MKPSVSAGLGRKNNMKATFDLDNGVVIGVKPENLHLVPNGDKGSALCVKTEQALVPVAFFTAVLATADEIKAREAAKPPKQ